MKINENKGLLIYALAALILVLSGCSYSTKKQHPNILIIYADDLGWSDLACYGNRQIETPNIDKLASEGMRFTNAYAPAPICSASRASIMTGKSPARLGFEFVSTDKRITDKPLLPPKRTLELPLTEITIGEVAKAAGYNTTFFGKWHIAKHNGGYLKWSDTHGPLQQGFEIGSDHYGSHPYDTTNRTPVDLQKGEFPLDTLLQKAVNYLQEQRKQDKPFLMVFSSYYVHTPVHPNNTWLIDKYKVKLPDATENEIKYAAFVETLDYYIGLLLNELDQLGMKENTLVIFTSDNGGHPGYTQNLPLRGNKWNLYEGGIREPFIVRFPSVVEEGISIDESIIQWDILPTICDVLGQPVPDNVDGISLLPVLTSEQKQLDRDYIYWHFPYYHPPKSYEGTKPCSAIRKGDYKMIYFYEDERSELYNLRNDIGETKDIGLELPEKTKELKLMLFEKLQAVNARFATINSNAQGK